MLLVRGEYEDVLRRLFLRTDEGRIRLGVAQSSDVVPDLHALTAWTDFRDYVMEGSVSYAIRVSEVAEGLALDVRLKGMNRDQYVAFSLKNYIRGAGFEAEARE